MATHREIRRRKAEIAQALDDGMDLSEIRSRFGVEDAYIKQCLDTAGLNRFKELRKAERRSLRETESDIDLSDPRSARDMEIITLAQQGMTLTMIGERLSLSRERVRQILANNSMSTRGIRRTISEEDELVKKLNADEVGQVVRTCPGINLEELRARLPHLADDLVEAVQPHLVLMTESNPRLTNESSEELERVVDSLRNASALVNPLTGEEYEKLRKSGNVQGLSRPRIIQLFGSWNAACDAAGVSHGETLRKSEYTRTFSHDQILEILGEFLKAEHEQARRGSIQSYDRWREELLPTRALPSSATIRIQVSGSWETVKHLALQRLRVSWE